MSVEPTDTGGRIDIRPHRCGHLGRQPGTATHHPVSALSQAERGQRTGICYQLTFAIIQWGDG